MLTDPFMAHDVRRLKAAAAEIQDKEASFRASRALNTAQTHAPDARTDARYAVSHRRGAPLVAGPAGDSCFVTRRPRTATSSTRAPRHARAAAAATGSGRRRRTCSSTASRRASSRLTMTGVRSRPAPRATATARPGSSCTTAPRTPCRPRLRRPGRTQLPLAGAWWTADPTVGPELHARTPVEAYRRFWNRINGPGTWDHSPSA